MNIKLRFPEIIILIAITSTLLYIISKNLPMGIGSFRFLWGPLSLIIIFFSRPIAITKGPMKFVLIFGVLSVVILQYTLWNYMDEWNRRHLYDDFYSLAIFTIMWNYFWVKKDFKKLAIISKYAFFCIIISLVSTNIALTIDPNIVRNSATGFYDNVFQARLSKLTGASGYSYSQAMVLLLPILVYHIKNRKRMVFPPKILIAILILLLITILRSNVFANVLVAAFITFLAFIGSKKPRITYTYIAIFVIIFAFIPNSIYANFFFSMGSHFDPSSELYYKLNDFASFILTPDQIDATGAGGRLERYPLLLDALFANPFFGYASYQSNLDISAGGHLYWMNKLTLWGIPGFLFYVFVLNKIYKTISSAFVDVEIKFYYFLSVVAFIMLGLMKNMDGREPWLLIIVVIPGLYFFHLIQPNKKHIAIKTIKK